MNSSELNNNKHIRELIAEDYRRIALILQHREFHAEIYKKVNNIILTTKHPIKKQAVESIVGLKSVFLRDIDFTKDHILKNSVLTLKSIDIPTVGISTSIVTIDDNNIAERVAIYNLKEDDDKIEQMFQIGCKFSIINPYIRMAADG